MLLGQKEKVESVVISFTSSQLPRGWRLVVENLWAAVQVIDHEIESPIVVQVSQGQTTAHPLLSEDGPEILTDLLEGSVALVAVEELALRTEIAAVVRSARTIMCVPPLPTTK